MGNSFYSIIRFPSSDTKNGVLTALECGKKNGLPFDVRRTLVIRGMKGSDNRGGHTHHKTRQVLVVVSGGCTVALDNGTNTATVNLSSPDEGLLLEPYVWHTMSDFKEGTVLLILADTLYDERDYIRNYKEFKKYIQK